ncbi:hypothetical protein XELAEV_18033110mg [Xenopus laevis]|uniref:PPM-type phosphatase domain-containing protein n=1 Tax=Xenopus laevis TaxID=8355 RepID=A0A974CIZ4_XENLA|nr:hypothetical protein XELAEV_18033110mg [Xenopus laevis]
MILQKRILISPAEDIRRLSTQDFENTIVYKMDKTNALIPSIAVCSDKNPSWQRDLEDSFVILDNYGSRSNTCLVGVFDGCHGQSAACTMALEFPVLLLGQLLNSDPSYKITEKERHFLDSFDIVFKEHYKDAEHFFSSALYEKASGEMDIKQIHISYVKAFWRMDRILQLGRKETSKARWSGCSSVTCLIDGGYADAKPSQEEVQLLERTHKYKRRLAVLHIANIGNKKAVLCRNGKPYCLTKIHNSCSSHEPTHVKENGGSYITNADQGLESVCRGLGYHGDPKLKKSIIPAPCTLSVPINPNCEFLVLGSSGLWDVLSDREVVSIAMNVLKDLLKSCNNSKAEMDYSQAFQNSAAAEDIHKVTNCINESSIVPERHDGLDEDGVNHGKPLGNNFNHGTASESGRIWRDNSREMYDNAAACVSQRLVTAAMLAGSQQNITVCLVLLPGCINISDASGNVS